MAKSIPVSEVAADWSVSEDVVRDLLKAGQLRGHKVGRCVRVYVESLEDYERRQEIRVPTKPPSPARRRRCAGHDQAMAALRRLGV